VRGRIVGADAKDQRIFRFKARVVVAQSASLAGTAGCVVLWVEEQDDAFAALFAELHVRPLIGNQVEIGRGVAYFEV
jgi:hypothetical protein